MAKRFYNYDRACIDCGALVGKKTKRCPTCRAVALKSRGTYVRTEAHRRKMSEQLMGKPKPWLKGKARPETNRKISQAWDDNMRVQAKNRGKAKASDPVWRNKISAKLKGKNNPRWVDGRAAKPYAPGFTKKLKADIRKRDNYTCQLCGITEQEYGKKLSVHHADYSKDNHDPENLFSTCIACNARVNTNRGVWYGYFLALASQRKATGRTLVAPRRSTYQKDGYVRTFYR